LIIDFIKLILSFSFHFHFLLPADDDDHNCLFPGSFDNKFSSCVVSVSD
jgi:hypothetical protein